MRHSQGFTIIELMIVVGLVGILSMVAAGYFGDNVIKANRTDGRSALTDTSGSLEKCKSLYGAYDNCTVTFPVDSDSNHYSITVARDETTFTLTATPVGSQLAADDDCTTLTLTHTGLKGATGANTDACW